MKKLKWFYPGMHLKRWISLVVAGFFLISVGLITLADANFVFDLGALPLWSRRIIGLIFMLIGVIGVVWGLRKIIYAVYEVALPDQETELVDLFYRKKYLKKGPQIVAIGGGTGLATLLRGLKHYTNNITALVTVADDGGSSGFLREELGILPPGDIRNCLAALADTEPLMKDLFQHRFQQGEGLAGHSFGNLLIAAMHDITGDFEHAVQKTSEVLAIRGRVLPVTLDDMSLSARLNTGRIIDGESRISKVDVGIDEVYINPEDSTPLPEALEAIDQAEVIVLGPGSLYTSILPNLLVDEVAERIKTTQALKIYVCNVMTQPGETDGYSAGDHVQTIYNHAGEQLMEYVIVNNEEVTEDLLTKYAEEGARPVKIDEARLKKQGVKLVKEPVINQSNLVRHDSKKLSQVIIDLVLETGLLLEK